MRVFTNLILTFFVFLLLNSISIKAQTNKLEATLQLQNVDGINIPYQNGIPLPSFEKQDRFIINLEGEWKKERFASNSDITMAKRDSVGMAALINEAQNRHLADYDDSGWLTKNLPAVENTMHTYPTVPEFYEDGVWYRKFFFVDDSLNNPNYSFSKLIFYAVNYVADVWINGNYIGYHEGGYTPFSFFVSGYLNYGDTNTIAVRVDNIPWGSRNDIVPYTTSDWFNYTGIIHDVYLEFSNVISTIRADVVPLSINGDIQTTITLFRDFDVPLNVNVSLEIFNAAIDLNNITSEKASELIGNPASFTGTSQTSLSMMDYVNVWRTNLNISNPQIWTPKSPNLYIMKVVLKNNNGVLDEFYTQFGIRTVAVDSNKFLLNNRISFLTGAARHEDHPQFGRSVTKDIIYSDLEIVKSLNVNHLRTAHYPNHLYTYLIADRLGITIMEEIPVYWFDQAEPWLIQNNERKIHLQMFREMVFKDYNRPSIILWSTSNECKEETNRLIYNQMIKEDISENYNDHRLVSQSSAADNPGPTDITQAPLDIAGWTLYFGIFHGGTYYGGTINFLFQAKNAFPDKPIIDTEFGYWSSENGSTTQEQVTVFTETFNAFKFFAALNQDGTLNPNGALMACTWWCVFDWYRMSLGYQSMGLYNMGRDTAKTVASTLRSSYLPYYSMDGIPVNIDEPANQNYPVSFELQQNYPNPFNPTTNIVYSILEKTKVTLIIYDILGREVAILVNEEKAPGVYTEKFNASDIANGLPSGVYIYKLKTKSFISVKKMVLIK